MKKISIRLPIKKELYIFEKKEIIYYYIHFSSFREIIDSNKYAYVDGYLCLKRNDNFIVTDGRLKVSSESTEFLLYNCVGNYYREFALHYNNVFMCCEKVKETEFYHALKHKSLNEINKNVFWNYISGEQEPPYDTFGKCLQYYLDERGLTHEEFSEIVGIAPETVSRICRDKNNPNLNTAVAICIGLHLYPFQSRILLSKIGYSLDCSLKRNRVLRLLIDLYYNETVDACNTFLREVGLKALTKGKR